MTPTLVEIHPCLCGGSALAPLAHGAPAQTNVPDGRPPWSKGRVPSDMDPIWTPHANEHWTPEGTSRIFSSRFNGRGDRI